MTAIEKFLPLLLEQEEGEGGGDDDRKGGDGNNGGGNGPTPLVSTEDGINFLYVRHNNLYRTLRGAVFFGPEHTFLEIIS